MTPDRLALLRRRFLDYAGDFIARAGDRERPLMELKREHCAFVARDARAIAEAEEWDASRANAAEALGRIHDIGRFPQLAEYGTFRDDESIDHGERGYRALIETGMLDDLPETERDALLDGVRFHNAAEIPSDLPPDRRAWVELVRDADRLDIYRVMLRALETGEVERRPEIVLGLPLGGPPSPAIVEAILHRRSSSYLDAANATDFLLLQLSWRFRMNHRSALKLMDDRRILERYAAHLPKDAPEIGDLFALLSSNAAVST